MTHDVTQPTSSNPPQPRSCQAVRFTYGGFEWAADVYDDGLVAGVRMELGPMTARALEAAAREAAELGA